MDEKENTYTAHAEYSHSHGETKEDVQNAAIRANDAQVADFIAKMDRDLAAGPHARSIFSKPFGSPKQYTWALIAFASMGGLLSGLDQFNIAVGEVIGYSIGAMFAHVTAGWRYMLGLSLIFSTIMFLGMLFLPESPRYLLHKGKNLEAYRIWKDLRGPDDLESNKEFYMMQASVRAEEQEVHAKAVNKRFPWMDFFTEPRARRSIVYSSIMVFFDQFTGCNTILYYLSVLMNSIGFDKYQSNYMSLVGGGALLFGTIPAVLFMERFGRRFWAIGMLPGFFIGLVLIGVSYLVNTETNIKATQGIYLTGMILYYGFFGSYACLTWVIPSEVYPTYLRSYGMTTSDMTLFLSAFLMTYNFTAMKNSMTPTGLTLGFYGAIAVIGWFYQILFMPETKDRTLEEIDFIFRKPTMVLVKENIASSKKTVGLILTGRWKDVFYQAPPHVRPPVGDARLDVGNEVA